MARLGFGKLVIKPLVLAIIVFVVIFLFFPAFSQEYLGVSYKKGNTTTELSQAAEDVLNKSGAKVDDLVDAANSDILQNMLDTGVDKGKEAVNQITEGVKDNL